MATFVLVHGAWHGGWVWDRVRTRLEGQGHEVFAPTLSGLAERQHLLRFPIDLDTHIADVVTLVTWGDLHDVVLCGHSYGGFPVTGAADALGSRVAALVYLDAFVPEDGDSCITLAGVAGASEVAAPAPPAEAFGLVGADATWVNERLTPQPTTPLSDAIALIGACTAPRTYVLATGWRGRDHFRRSYEHALQNDGWTARTLDGCHDLMVDRPDEVATLLAEAWIAGSSRTSA